MPLAFRHYKQILEDWVSYVIGGSDISDINPGSKTRTIGEATAIEAAQLYVQLRNVLNLFSIDKAAGDDLDERALDFDIEREAAQKSTVDLAVGDSDLTVADTASTTLDVALTTGSTEAEVADHSSFPAAGFIIVDRSNSSRELIEYTGKAGSSPDLLTLATNPVNAHDIGAAVQLSTVGFDRTIDSGTIARTEGTEVKFETTEDVTLLDGDFQVTQIDAASVETGSDNNVAANTIVVFESPPFPTATVTNVSPAVGATDREEDAELRARIKASQQALSSATALVIENAVSEVELADGQRVITSKLVEPVAPGESILYINDGTTGYSPDTQSVAETEVIISIAESGQIRGGLLNWPIQTGTEVIYVSLDRGVATSVGTNFLTDTGQSWGVDDYAGWEVKDSNDEIFAITSNTSDTLTTVGDPAIGAYAIFNPAVTTFPIGSRLEKDTDYIINDTNGQIELTVASFPSGLSQYDTLIAYYDTPTSAYVYYTGLLQEVQKVLNGDPNDLDNYPGIIALGTKVVITPPTVVTITIEATLSAQPGIDESTIRDSVESALIQYVNTIDIGGDVLLSRLIEAALSVEGVFDITFLTPTTNVVIASSALPKTTSGDITLT